MTSGAPFCGPYHDHEQQRVIFRRRHSASTYGPGEYDQAFVRNERVWISDDAVIHTSRLEKLGRARSERLRLCISSGSKRRRVERQSYVAYVERRCCVRSVSVRPSGRPVKLCDSCEAQELARDDDTCFSMAAVGQQLRLVEIMRCMRPLFIPHVACNLLNRSITITLQTPLVQRISG